MHLAYIWIVSHLSAKNYRNLWKFDKVLTKTNLLSFFGTRCTYIYLIFSSPSLQVRPPERILTHDIQERMESCEVKPVGVKIIKINI